MSGIDLGAVTMQSIASVRRLRTPHSAASSAAPSSPASDRAETTGPRWRFPELCGRLVELSAWGNAAPLTLAFDLVWQAQHAGEPAAWVTSTPSSFFPHDAAHFGVDLDALPVVRVPSTQAAARAADKLLRSGAFALVVLDLGARAEISPPLQTRLLGLARKHDAAVLFLTEKKESAPSLGPLVSLRAQALRTRTADNRFVCEARVLKDKRRGPGWSHKEMHRGPAGLR